jgi:hypothetical protein
MEVLTINEISYMQTGIIIGLLLSVGVIVLFFITSIFANFIDNSAIREKRAPFFAKNKSFAHDFEKIKSDSIYALTIIEHIDIPYASAFFDEKQNYILTKNEIKNKKIGNFQIQDIHCISNQIVLLVKCEYRTYREVTNTDFVESFSGNSFSVMKNGKPVIVKIGDEIETGIYIFYQYFRIKPDYDAQKLSIYGYYHKDNGEAFKMKEFAAALLEKLLN